MSRLPDFLCIGAQKAGTTWLHHNLSQHPFLWLPPLKELHYFDHPHRAPSALLLPLPTWQGRRARKELPRLWQARRQRALFRWHLRFLARPRGDAWYSSLFEPESGQLCGEVTPGYDTLPDAAVARIRELMPNLKIIYLLRDPIDRIWSALAMHADKHGWGPLDSVSEDRVFEYLRWDVPLRHSAYLQNLDTWTRHFPREQVHVDFHDRLGVEAEALYRDICGFLGVDDSSDLVPFDVSEPRYARDYAPMARPLEDWLVARFRDDVEELNRVFDVRWTADWVRRLDCPRTARG